MPNMITIGGSTVDADDPCALYQALYATKLKLISGEMVGEYSIQSPVTRDSVTFSPSNLRALDAELTRLASACQQKTTGRRPTRRWSLRY
jgi:hypothetical protein